MRKLHAIFLLLLLLLICSTSVGAARRVTCYTTWDSYYLYAAFEVQDPDIESTNVDHMSKPWEDDAIEVYLQNGSAASKAYCMSVSAGGGSSWLVRENGQTAPKKIFTFKYANKVQGTINNPADRDLGYVIELAMPWTEMGGPPAAGSVLNFNVICRIKGELSGLSSFSPNVKTVDDIWSTSQWGKIKFTDTPSIIASDNGAIVCRKVLDSTPIVDGNLNTGEWPRDLSFNFALPEPEIKPGVKQIFGIEKVAMATYSLNSGSQSALVNSVTWHKNQLHRMAKTGIDVALVSNMDTGDSLDSMIQALKELKAEGNNFPLIGMFVDKNSFVTKTSLESSDNKIRFYNIIKNFFSYVPKEFRASVELPSEKGGEQACIVVLPGFTNDNILDQSVIDYANEQFAKDFDGKKLIWIGDSSLKSVALDGYMGDPSTRGTKSYDESGWIKTAWIGPAATAQGERKGVDAYKADWDEILAKPVDWVIIDSWNDTGNGSEISPSLKYFDTYTDATKFELIRFNSMHPYDAKYLGHDTPSVMLPGAFYQISLNIKNSGMKPWYPQDGVYLAGRWYKDGALYADSSARLPIQERGLAGLLITKTIGVRAIDSYGNPLPEGNYELRFEMTRGHDNWFADGGDLPLVVPVKIGTPAFGFTVVGSTMPASMKAGTEYKVGLRIRNDGPTTWKASETKLNYSWEGIETFAANPGVAITTDVEPGRIVDVTLPVSTPDPRSGVLHFMLSSGKDSAIISENINIVAHDMGLRIISLDAPTEMLRAGKDFSVTVTLENKGLDTWDKTKTSIQLSMNGPDGNSTAYPGTKVFIPSNVPPGERATVKLQFTAPEYDGTYNLTGVLSTTDSPETDMFTVNYVKVVKGKNM